ncbi:MAG TPA: endolytic transglycosylase MltG [Aggregatilineales bacterium]|nr:endolytic transglycosylase MltG [Anaerolineales bacterium]HRE46327.1 endolytic transglycosylase MltG [Aggregatilineales bacterium]
MRTTLIVFRNLLIPLILAGLLMLGLLVGLVFLIGRSAPHLNPLDAFALRLSLALRSADLDTPAGIDGTVACFTVIEGDTAATIANRLVAQGFEINPEVFRAYVRFFAIDSKLQAGSFVLKKTMTIPQIATKLTNAGADSVTFRVIEGWRLEEIAATIDQTPDLTFRGAEFLTLVGAGFGGVGGYLPEFAARAGIPPGHSLEGFLFPDTYQLPACGTAADLVVRMLQNFDVRIPQQLRDDSVKGGLTLYEAVTLASIIQREAVLDEERAVIAGVYLNRLKNSRAGTPDAATPRTLDADPTIQYALGNTRDPNTWWAALTLADYRGVNSPFNTYLNPGLPPTPIANPGLASIRAAIYPQTTDYIYFRACGGEGGRHRFSRTFAEHNAACSN